MKVSCGGHDAYYCSLCGDDKSWCNGDCSWVPEKTKCAKYIRVERTTTTTSIIGEAQIDGRNVKNADKKDETIDPEDENGRETTIAIIIISIIVVGIASLFVAVVLKKRSRTKNEEIVKHFETNEGVSNNLFTTTNISPEDSHYINAEELQV